LEAFNWGAFLGVSCDLARQAFCVNPPRANWLALGPKIPIDEFTPLERQLWIDLNDGHERWEKLCRMAMAH
jgi:hypothetical protein